MKNDRLRFKEYLLNERQEILAHRMGDIITAVKDLNNNAPNLGTRILAKRSETIVNMIRRILHASWQKEQDKQLKQLQKIGVAIMKAIDEKDDLKSVLVAVSDELEKGISKLGKPVNSIGSDEKAPDTEEDQMPKHEGKKEKVTPPPVPPPAGAQPGQMPDQSGVPGTPPGMPMPPAQMPQM